MEKIIINVNNFEVTIMEQPASYMLELERKFNRKQMVDYTKEILKYPSGVNKTLEEIIGVPEKIVYKDLELSLNQKDGLYTMEKLFIAGLENYVFTGEAFLKLLNKKVDDFKYKDIQEMGEKIWEQVKEIAVCGYILSEFHKF